jgi:alpha,alpha-trehalase
MKNFFFVCTFLFFNNLYAQQAQQPPSPDAIYGKLFTDVQLQKILADGKTFVDCTPKQNIDSILNEYKIQKNADFDLKKFVLRNFNLPITPPLNNIKTEDDITQHIHNLWAVLKRNADVKTVVTQSLLPLPYPYVVPGGRFREIYYWDSYFTMLGLKQSGEIKLMENMVKNFAYLINTYGHIPNGNRSYYLSRSQPPFFCMMISLLATVKGNGVYNTYLPAMLKEYSYWMQGNTNLKPNEANKSVVKMQNGAILNRYWDSLHTPRPESYKEDYETAETTALQLAMRIKVASPEALQRILEENKANTYRNLRAGACSGWDFSSRWFADNLNINTIQTTQIIPIDLNCLLYEMENTIAKTYTQQQHTTQANIFYTKAKKRKAAILKYCWNANKGYFYDYNFATQQQADNITAAGLYPIFVKLANAQQAIAIAKITKKLLLKPGGLATTTLHTGQQWDAPNGWAPLQWIAVKGFNNYNQTALANTIAKRWLALNNSVYKKTGKMMEKYNVEDITQLAGGGEYPSQDGFGWTNGVYLALYNIYK